MSITRYDPAPLGDYDGDMDESTNGDYVKFADYARLLAVAGMLRNALDGQVAFSEAHLRTKDLALKAFREFQHTTKGDGK